MTLTAIIGLDGATFRIIDQHLDRLPTFSRLLSEGYNSRLRSTEPPITSVAWPALATGQNPARYGIFDFLTRDHKKLSFNLTDIRKLDMTFFWHYMNESIGLASVPMIPYRSKSGFFVQGSLARINQQQIVNPPEITDSVTDAYEYSIDPDDSSAKIVDNVMEKIAHRESTFCDLIESYDLPLYFLVFEIIDHVQHHFWAHYDESHPAHPEQGLADVIPAVYERVDQALEKIINSLPNNANLVVVSDHGFGPRRFDMNVNAVLESNGFLSYKSDTTTQFSRILRSGKELISDSFLYDLIPDHLKSVARDQMVEREQFGDAVAWSETSAFSFGASGNIYLNLAGRERDGTVQLSESDQVLNEITETFRDLRHNNESVITSVKRGEDVYDGYFESLAPDLIVQAKQGYRTRSTLSSTVFSPATQPMPNSGMHEPEGIFVATGPDFLSSKFKSSSGTGQDRPLHDIIDIAPTLLHLYGYPIPDSIDGTVVSDALMSSRAVDRKKVRIPERNRITRRVLAIKQLGLI